MLHKVIRTNSLEDVVIEDDDIIFDIGGGKFDHHQIGAEVRDNGIPYAVFGLLWREYSPKLGLHPWIAEIMDKEFVSLIDETDNSGQTKCPNALSALVSACFKAGRSFEDTVDLIIPMLDDLIKTYRDLSDQKRKVELGLFKLYNRGC
jgi:uncharacterized UPF0160 family protein